MADKIRIVPGSVQETLIIPLYGRKLCSERFSSLYTDKSAAQLCERLDYDFSDLEAHASSVSYQFGALEAAMREIDMEWEIRDYLASHPAAAVVNMGCGLDQTARACDNGSCQMYNVDLPDIIAAREELIVTGDREHNIAADLNDYAWMDGVAATDGAIFFAAGVFHYFTEAQAKALVNALASRFPGCRIVFDVIGKLGRLLMRKTFKGFGMENYDECLYVEDPAALDGWCLTASVSTRGYMLGYHNMDDACVPGIHRVLARLCDNVVKMRIVRMDCLIQGDQSV
ncbi:MAG: class I SAM-dependent methyltransferase [Coriobacteriales bacterium]|nr:class I SAM-dependent methyltransferase [Coriobacteriales bacterium]